MGDAIRKLLFWQVVAVLSKMKEYEEKGYNPTISKLIEAAGISQSLFHTSLKRKFQEARLPEYKRKPDRTITVHLTEKERRHAVCLERCRSLVL